VKRAASFSVDASNLAHLTRWLIYCARRAPSCLSFVAEHLAALQARTASLPNLEIEAYIQQQLKVKSEFAHTDEVAWLLFWACEIGLNLPAALLDSIKSLRSSVIALLALDLNQRGQVDGTLDTSFWENFANTDGLKSELWLVCYEATKKNWWPRSVTSTFISGARFFSDIWGRDVEF